MGEEATADTSRPNTDFSADRPAIDIQLPAITRNIAFRIPNEKNPRVLEDRRERRAAWEYILHSLCSHLNGVAEVLDAPRPHATCELDKDQKWQLYCDGLLCPVGRSIIFEYNSRKHFRGRFRVRADIYNEMIAITYIVDHLVLPAAKTGLSAIFRRVTEIGEPQRSYRHLNWLQIGFWKKLEIRLSRLPANGLLEAWPQLLDFRGLYVDCMRRKFPRPLDREPQYAKLIDFAERRRAFVDRAIGRPTIHSANGVIRQSDDLNRGEAVFCFMLGGNALYLAELGRRDPNGNIVPLRHMLVFANAPSAQVGRFVRRLHVMGELRHAALFDYDNGNDPDLRDVSRTLRVLGPGVDALLAESEGNPERADGEGQFALSEDNPQWLIFRQSLMELSRSRSKAADVGVQNRNDIPSKTITKVLADVSQLRATKDEGVVYRIEQSRYYAEEFRHGLKHLRIEPIPGYQSYEDFVSRYIFQAFARIDAIGKRYDAMLRRLNLATAYPNTAAIQKSSERQIMLLKTAESIAYAIVAYYAGSSLHGAVEETFNRESAIGHVVKTAVAWLWFAAVVWFAVLAYRQVRRADQQLGRPKDGAATAAGAFDATPID